MTRSELIRKLAKYSGVPESETKVFFEIFLKKFPVILRTGQALKLEKFGFFYLLQGKIRKPRRYQEDEEQFELVDLVYFSKSEIKDISKFEGLFFSVPVSDEEEFNAVDASFSLSFGKPLIPLKGNIESDFYIPHTGLELRRLIESKVDKTIESSEFTEVIEKITGPLNIEAEMFRQLPDQTITDVQESEDVLELDKFKNEESSENVVINKDADTANWELNRDLTKQIEEDAILDLADESEGDDIDDQDMELSWDFASFDEIVAKIKKKTDEIDDELEDEQTSKVDIEYDKNQETDTAEQTDKQKEDEPKEKFERVKTLTKLIDANQVDKTPESEEELFEEEEIIDDEDSGDESSEAIHINDIEDDSDYVELRSITEELTSTVENDEPDKSELKEEDRKKILFSSRNEERERFERLRKRKSSTIIPYILLLFSVLIIAYAIYYYINNIKGVSEQVTETVSPKLNTDNIITVERDFGFPVTFPYKATTENQNKIDEFLSANFEETASITEDVTDTENMTETIQNLPQESTQTRQIPGVVAEVNDKAPEGNVTRVGVNVFKYGQYYIVQVAAFRSLSVAQTEAARFRNKGYNSFVERADVEGTLWHRVKVGNFTNLETAEKFAVQFK